MLINSLWIYVIIKYINRRLQKMEKTNIKKNWKYEKMYNEWEKELISMLFL